MLLKTAWLILAIGTALLLPALIALGQESDPPVAGEGKEDLAAIVRGLIITWHDVDKEVVRLKASPLTADMTDAMLRWQARTILAGNILLLEEARQYTKNVDDELVRQWWVVRHELDPDYVSENFEALKNDYITDLYFWARCGLTNLEGVVPDMASFIRVTPKEIKDYYRNGIDQFTQEASTVLIWVLFPESAFGEPADARRFATECGDLLRNPDMSLEKLATDYSTLSDRWPGCIPRKTEIGAGKETSFQPRIMEFVDGGSEGAVSDPIELEGGLVVAGIVAKTEAKVLTFDEVQYEVAKQLKSGKMNQARLLIIQDLARKERFFFPSDLFEREPVGDSLIERPAEK